MLYYSCLTWRRGSLAEYHLKPLMYRRYHDDLILLWLFGLEKLLRFVDFFNSRHPSIKFTLESSRNGEEPVVNFLDLTITAQGGRLDWELYMKPTQSGVHLSFQSSLPMQVKRSVAGSQMRRAISNASTPVGESRGLDKIARLLHSNDYPENEIRPAKTVAIKQVKKFHKPTQGRAGGEAPLPAVLKLPFINDRLAKEVRRRVRRYSPGVRVGFTSRGSLRDILVTASSERPCCLREKQRRDRGRGRPRECRACDAGMPDSLCVVKGVVYSMFCTVCGKEYVGETECPVHVRFGEHYREARGRVAKSPWGFHCRTQNGDVVEATAAAGFEPFNNAQVVGRETSLPSRKIMEAIEIRDRRPEINEDEGWLLTE